MMARYILLRLIGLLPTTLVITLLSFSIVQIAPGDPALMLIQQRGFDPTPELVEQVREEIGMSHPFGQRYGVWAWQALHGDLGQSFYSKNNVLDEIRQHLPATIELTAVALSFSVAVSFSMGLLSAWHPGKAIDIVSSVYAMLAVSMPSYWLGLLLIYFLAVKLHLLPAVGRSGIANLVMPAITLGFTSAAVHARLLRNELLQMMQEGFAHYARSRGLTRGQILLRHALRPSLMPVVTSIGNSFGHMLGGAVIVESIFAWPGLGKMVMDAIFNRDYPLIQGYVLAMAVLYTVVNLLIDLLCAWIDPRVRLEGGNRRL